MSKGRATKKHVAEAGAARKYEAPDHGAARKIELRPGWQPVENIHLPAPTYWPAVVALGITFLAWGIVTSLVILAVGLILLAVGIAGWIGDMLHEH